MFDKTWARANNLPATREATKYLFKVFFGIGLNKPRQFKSIFNNLCICIIFPLTFVLSYYFDFEKMSISQLLTSLQVAFNVCGIPIKILTILTLFKHLQDALDITDILDKRCHLQEEYKKIRHCSITGNRLTVFYLVSYFLYAFVTMLTSVIMGQPPYSLFMPIIDWRNSTLEFVLQSFLEYMMMNLICFNQTSVDNYGVIYIHIIRTHMQILVKRVRNLGTEAKEEENTYKGNEGQFNMEEEERKNEKYYEQLLKCIEDHQNLLRLLDIIHPVISITIFIQFTITAVILGTTLINILVFADFSTQIASIVYFLAVVAQTSPCCYQATCLLEDNEKLSLAIFHCEWIEKDIRFRKMMIFFMMRSQKPMSLTALKLFPITLNTSLSIAKFSFSIYTLVKQMDFGQNWKDD